MRCRINKQTREFTHSRMMSSSQLQFAVQEARTRPSPGELRLSPRMPRKHLDPVRRDHSSGGIPLAGMLPAPALTSQSGIGSVWADRCQEFDGRLPAG